MSRYVCDRFAVENEVVVALVLPTPNCRKEILREPS